MPALVALLHGGTDAEKRRRRWLISRTLLTITWPSRGRARSSRSWRSCAAARSRTKRFTRHLRCGGSRPTPTTRWRDRAAHGARARWRGQAKGARSRGAKRTSWSTVSTGGHPQMLALRKKLSYSARTLLLTTAVHSSAVSLSTYSCTYCIVICKARCNMQSEAHDNSTVEVSSVVRLDVCGGISPPPAPRALTDCACRNSLADSKPVDARRGCRVFSEAFLNSYTTS